MLVLTRKKGERVMVGDDIVVTIIDVRGDGVRIGFDAPRGVPIQRAEVLTAVREANAEAAATSAASADLLVGLLAKAAKPETTPQGAGEQPTVPTPTPASPPPPAPAPAAGAAPKPGVPKPGPRRPAS
jgi:carbon storage regulator